MTDLDANALEAAAGVFVYEAYDDPGIITPADLRSTEAIIRAWLAALPVHAEPERAMQVTAAFITPDCRFNRGIDGAWDEACARLYQEYVAILDGRDDNPTLNLVLTMDRPGVSP